MKVFNIVIILSYVIIISCKGQNTCDLLDYGTFKLYDDRKEIGEIYRDNSFQIEKYLGDETHTIAFLNKKSECNYYLRSYYIKSDFDTITVLVSYKNIGDKIYSFEMKAAYIDTLSYQYKGELKKVSDNINNKEVLKLFKELKENKDNSSN